MHKLLVLGLAVAGAQLCGAYYLPGVTPVDYQIGDPLSIKVNSIKSAKTAIPFDYYSLMFCRPEGGKVIKADVENFGEILWGDVIKPSALQAKMRVEIKCQKLCTTKPKPEEIKPKMWHRTKAPKVHHRQLKKLKNRIDEQYRGHMILDNLPVSEVFIWEGRANSFYYRTGYPLGVAGNRTTPTLVNNHLALTIKYHRPEGQPNGARIVGFNVVAHSISSSVIDSQCKPSNDEWHPSGHPPQTISYLPENPTRGISWSYSVKWEEDLETEWATRWDAYFQSADATNAKIHWFSIVNSLLIVLLLSSFVAVILLRSLHRDFNRYHSEDGTDEEKQEETGWKLVHRDVFRTPQYWQWLCVYTGTGVQLLGMIFAVLIFAILGFLSPANRGALLSCILLLFVLMGSLGGFVAATLARMFHKTNWVTIGLQACTFPGQVSLVFFVVDLMLWSQGASNAVPFTTMLTMIGLWFGVSVPLAFVGGSIGYRKCPAVTHPKQVSQNPRNIPEQEAYMSLWITAPLAAIMPFGAAFIEIYFVMSSLWQQRFYYVFGFLALVAVILFITCAEVSIVTTYFQLCSEDYHWWWRSFWASGFSGVHLFLYSLFYLAGTLKLKKFVSIWFYVSTMAVLSGVFTIVTGTIGFLASLLFVRIIYSNLRVD